jgi:hypothetical protein
MWSYPRGAIVKRIAILEGSDRNTVRTKSRIEGAERIIMGET